MFLACVYLFCLVSLVLSNGIIYYFVITMTDSSGMDIIQTDGQYNLNQQSSVTNLQPYAVRHFRMIDVFVSVGKCVYPVYGMVYH